MISAFRRSLDTWPVRIFFLLMVVAFVVWGVGDVVRNMIASSPTWVAKVGNQTIEAVTFQAEYQKALNQAAARLPNGQEVPADLRHSLGQETLQRLIGQAALAQEVRRLRIATPDAAVRNAIFAMPAFRGSDGRFSRQVFESVLQNNGLTEQGFIELMRQQLADQQMLEAVAVGATAPQMEAMPLFQEQFEKRSADMAEFPFDAETAPAPTPAELQRWYANHPYLYTTPAMRRIRAIILSPQTLAQDIPITDQELHTAYEQQKRAYVTPAKRSVEVITVPDQGKAQALAAQWQKGADWTAMQAAAIKDAASAIAMNDAAQGEFPDAALAKAVFAAPVDTVPAPVKGALGWYVLKVVKATPGSEKTFDQVKDALRNRLLAEKGTDLMYTRANKVDDLLGNGTPMDQLPGNLGLVGVTGTMDAQGNTAEGTPAPIPGPPALRSALIAAAFKAHKGDLPQLTEVQTPSVGGSAFYAVSVLDEIPPAVKPFDAVKQQVAQDWADHQKRHAAEEKAAKLLTALKGGQKLEDAAAVAGVQVSRTSLVTRDAASQAMPPALANVLFGLKPGEPTMVPTDSSIVVAVPAQIDIPKPDADKVQYDALRQAVNRSVGNDMATIFAQAVRERANPRINQANYDSIVQP